MKKLCALVFGTFLLVGCATASQPAPASTLSEAIQSATLATNFVDIYVNSAKVNRADLVKIQSANDAVHAALTQLEKDQANGVPLQFSAFNAAVATFNSYAGK